MKNKIYSERTFGFFSEKNQLISPSTTPSNTSLELPVLAYRAFATNALHLFHGSHWGVVLPMEVVLNLRVVMPVSTRKSDAESLIYVRWSADDGSAEYTSTPLPVSIPGNVELIEIPPSEIKKFELKTLKISYAFIKDGHETLSPELPITVAPQLLYKSAIIEGVTDNTLKISDHPHGLTTTIPAIKNLREYNAISMNWMVFDQNLLLFSHSETVLTTNPDSDCLFHIPVHAYSPYQGFSCTALYEIWLGAELDPSLRWSTGVIEFGLI